MASFESFLKVLRHYEIEVSKAQVLEVGGTEQVWLLRGRVAEVARNPLLSVVPNLTFLDRGFTVQRFNTRAHEVTDFLDPLAIEHLRDKFDLAVSFETLEHVPNPFKFCEHLVSVTKPGGYIWVSTVFSYAYHPSPEDYYRFSTAGLKQCFLDRANPYRDQIQVIWADWDTDEAGVSTLVYKGTDGDFDRNFKLTEGNRRISDCLEKRLFWMIKNGFRLTETAAKRVKRAVLP